MSFGFFISFAIFVFLFRNAVFAAFTISKSVLNTITLRQCPAFGGPSLVARLVPKQRIELDPRHVGLRDVGNVAAAAFADGRLRRSGLVWPWVVAEGEEPPAVGLRESFAVLDRHVDAVELAVEEAAAGWFLARTVRKRWSEQARQLFHEDGSFRKDTGLQIR